MLSREPGALFRHQLGPPAPAASVERQADAEMLRILPEVAARDLRDILRSVATYECPAGTVAYSSDRFEGIKQRAAEAVGAM